MDIGKDTLDEIIIDISLETGSTIRVKITGRSMMPLVRSGAVLGIRPCREIKKGDIILFRLSGRMIAHRVIKSSQDIFTTKGDASIFFDPPVRRQEIIGKAVFIESEGRRTDIDTGMWRMLNCILAYYSCACGVVLGRILKAPRITVAFNLLLPMLVYILTRRL